MTTASAPASDPISATGGACAVGDPACAGEQLSARVWLFIALVAGSATILAAAALARSARPDHGSLILAALFAAAIAIAWIFPIPLGPKSETLFYIGPVIAAVLVLPPGLAMVVAGSGALAAHLVKRYFPGETIFNTGQLMLQAAAGGAVLRLAAWEPDHLTFDRPSHVVVAITACVMIQATATLLVAAIISVQTGSGLIAAWRGSLRGSRQERLSMVAEWGNGILIAIVAAAHDWAVVLLALPAVAVYGSLKQHVHSRRQLEAALRRSDANLAEAQRITHLGSWEWEPRSGAITWSAELYRIHGEAPDAFPPSSAALVARAHPDERDRLEQAITRAAAVGEPADFEYRIVRADGAARVVHARIQLVGGESPERAPTVVGALYDVTERKALEARLYDQAFHDALTGLPNRAAFLERLEWLRQADADRPPAIALLFIDLDGFKAVNDHFGHDAGDLLLVTIAHRLRAGARPHDFVARLAGDEFTVLVEGVESEREAAELADRILSRIVQPAPLPGGEARVSASIGLVVSRAPHRSAAELLKEADAAMYQAKAAGKARFVRAERSGPEICLLAS